MKIFVKIQIVKNKIYIELRVLSSEVDPAEIGLIRKPLLKRARRKLLEKSGCPHPVRAF
jgi:hypothetical protein